MIERLKLQFIGKNGSMGLKKNAVYLLRGRISDGYIYLNINGYAMPYTISGFMANWRTVKENECCLFDYICGAE